MDALQKIDLSEVVVVGAGFFGSVIAERIASVCRKSVVVIDKRDHIGGNCFTKTDHVTSVNVHCYGTHIFHTSDQEVWNYLNRFTEFNSYQHRVLTTSRSVVYSMPINLSTINRFYGLHLRPEEAEQFLLKEVQNANISAPNNLEEKAISLIGKPLYEAFIKGYSEKQWETDLRKVPASVITRLPVRYNYNDRYFNDTYEGIPVGGYTPIFDRMLDHDLISTFLGVDYFKIRSQISPKKLIIYTGPIDQFFDYRFGLLGWRTLRMETEVLETSDYQGTSVMNFADIDVPYTRVHEFKHLHPEKGTGGKGTVIMREYSKFATENDDPYYPINTEQDRETFRKYKELADSYPSVVFGGRLARYQYLDMHQVIGAALQTFQREVQPKLID